VDPVANREVQVVERGVEVLGQALHGGREVRSVPVDHRSGRLTSPLLERATERRGIAVLVRPELVVEIALDGVQSSTRYPGGVALRFARVKRFRPDKRADEADTVDDLRGLLRARS
jgi:ATP-dependent DNA ligase